MRILSILFENTLWNFHPPSQFICFEKIPHAGKLNLAFAINSPYYEILTFLVWGQAGMFISLYFEIRSVNFHVASIAYF